MQCFCTTPRYPAHVLDELVYFVTAQMQLLRSGLHMLHMGTFETRNASVPVLIPVRHSAGHLAYIDRDQDHLLKMGIYSMHSIHSAVYSVHTACVQGANY